MVFIIFRVSHCNSLIYTILQILFPRNVFFSVTHSSNLLYSVVFIIFHVSHCNSLIYTIPVSNECVFQQLSFNLILYYGKVSRAFSLLNIMVYFHNEIIKVRIWLPDLRQLWNVFIPNLLRERAVRFFLLEKVFKTLL